MVKSCAAGKSFPLGATPYEGGVNFSVFSQTAVTVELLLFDQARDTQAARTIRLDPQGNRTANYWHVFVPGLLPGQLYGFRVHGPFDPRNGHRYDPEKVLLDPYGRCVASGNYSRASVKQPGDSAGSALKSVVTESRSYGWEGDAPLYRPLSQSVI